MSARQSPAQRDGRREVRDDLARVVHCPGSPPPVQALRQAPGTGR